VTDGVTLIVRRRIRASADRLFDAWTRPEQLRVWWGPRPVTCAGADVDLRVGGRYRIENAMPDGAVVIVEGELLEIERPNKLVYTWCMRQGAGESSLVTVRFVERGETTEVVVVHGQVPSPAERDSHEAGWSGCLDGLAAMFATA
jgi:uncharacterized protein YndB with AHSA1/START domain